MTVYDPTWILDEYAKYYSGEPAAPTGAFEAIQYLTSLQPSIVYEEIDEWLRTHPVEFYTVESTPGESTPHEPIE
jgi:hypothetical protein